VTRTARIPLPAGGVSPARAYSPDLAAAIDGFYRAATRLAALDPVATEVLRLRCARHHDCRICKAVRLRDAREAGVDEAFAARIDDYESSDLDERLKVMLRYVDAFITAPASVRPELAAALARHYTRAQIVEITLDVMKFSTQKMHVALGLDVMDGVDVESGAVTYFEFDPAGRPVDFSPA
jgi:alkylhydroperoxidase family enzyme